MQITTHTCKIIGIILWQLLSGVFCREFLKRSVRRKLFSDNHQDIISLYMLNRAEVRHARALA